MDVVADDELERLWPLTVVPEDDLIGRRPVMQSMLAELSSGRSVMLAAPRRLGKTSVAQEVLRQLRERDWIAVSLDFMRIATRRQFAEELTKQLVEASHSLRERLKRASSAARNAVSGLSPHIRLAEVEIGMDFREAADEAELFRRALELPQELAAREKRRVVVLMDEFQEAGANLGQKVYGVLRSYFQEQPDVQQVFAGSRTTLLRRLFTKPNAPLLRYAAEIPIPLVPASEWAPYIARKFASAGISCSEQLATVLLERTGCHPADTMEACQQLYLLLRAYRDTTVTFSNLQVALNQTELRLRTVFEEVWLGLGTTAYVRRVAERIARGEPPLARSSGVAPNLLAKALRALVDKGIVEKTGRRDYRFIEPLFQRYVLGG